MGVVMSVKEELPYIEEQAVQKRFMKLFQEPCEVLELSRGFDILLRQKWIEKLMDGCHFKHRVKTLLGRELAAARPMSRTCMSWTKRPLKRRN